MKAVRIIGHPVAGVLYLGMLKEKLEGKGEQAKKKNSAQNFLIFCFKSSLISSIPCLIGSYKI